MANLSKTGITSGYSITPAHITNLYDCLTGDISFNNINLAKFSYLNAGGTVGAGGYGIRNNSGTMEFKNNSGAWAAIATGSGASLSPGGSNMNVQYNDGGGGFAGSSKFIYNSTDIGFAVGDFANTANNTYISMSDLSGEIILNTVGTVTNGDYYGYSLGTYISIDDPNEIIRLQCEGDIFIGDDDWIGYGNSTHLSVNDSTMTISMSATNGVLVSTLATGASIDVGADADGKLQLLVSDYRLKKNIEPIPNALDKVLHMDGVSFKWKTEEEGNDYFKGGTKKHIGFIAQDVEKVVPEVVFQKNGYYGMNYNPLVALLVEAIKDQQPQIDELMERLDKLENNNG
jgi:hypothetical protein